MLAQVLGVLVAVLAVSVPLSLRMQAVQRRTLVGGLVQRVDTLLAGLAASAANNLPERNIVELTALRDQAGSMPESAYVTLTSFGLGDPGHFDYLWLSTDSQVARKTEGGRFAPWRYGELRFQDEVSPEVEKLAEQVNSAGRLRLSAIADEIDRLGAEVRKLVLQSDARSRERIKQLDAELLALSARLGSGLQEIRGQARSLPPLDPRKPPRELAPSYLFYLPVVYRQREEDVYFRGAVRLAVSTARIRAELAGWRRRLLLESGILTVVAFGLGLAVVFGVNSVGAPAPAARRPKSGRLTVRKERKV
jgi:hypothetical protein